MIMMSTFNNEIKTLDYYIKLFFEEKCDNSKDTSSTYLNSLQMMSRRMFGIDVFDLTKDNIEDLTHDVIEGYKRYLLSIDNSNTTVNNRISSIKSFIKYLTARKVIQYDIAQLELVETLNDDSEITEMIPEEVAYEYAEYFYTNERQKGLEKKWVTLLLLETGNRANEILKLKKNQFIKDGDSYILKSKGKNRGKGSKEYFERIGVELYDELMKLNPKSDKVFSITYDSLNNAFERANKHFGNELIKYTPHSLKHLAVTLEYRYTGDILAAQRKGKHSSLETTRRYLRMEDIVHLGAYSRRISTKIDMYKQVELNELVSAIDTLPTEFKDLLNQKLQFMSNK